METIIIGFPIISKLVRGQTVQLSNVALIPDDQLFNESKNMDCCVKFPLPTAEDLGAEPVQPPNSTKVESVTLCTRCKNKLCSYKDIGLESTCCQFIA